MVSPAEAAATAAEIVDLQPKCPAGLTHRVDATARLEASKKDTSPKLMKRHTELPWILHEKRGDHSQVQ